MTHSTRSIGWQDVLGRGDALIGMVHVGALPGTPRAELPVAAIAERAAAEATIIAEAGFDAMIIENMHDAPYVHGDRLGPEITAAMTAAAGAVARAIDIPLGVQILSGGNRHAMAAAASVGGAFIRCENFVFSHVADEGLLAEAEAGPLLRYRKQIGAERIGVFCDIKKKHASHAITADVPIEAAAEAAAFFGADALIVTGESTGRPTDPGDVERAAAATPLPVLVGSGVTPESVPRLLGPAAALIVGSAIKKDGTWSSPVSAAACEAIVAARDSLR
ncbi:MAG: BtpA/SgcQ family protein [Planctomycetota bacterium]